MENKRKRENGKAFTLIEVLAVIVILSIIIILGVVGYNKIIKDSKKISLEQTYSNIKKTASYIALEYNNESGYWGEIDESLKSTYGENNVMMCISVQDMINLGYYKDEDIKKNNISNDLNVIVVKNTDSLTIVDERIDEDKICDTRNDVINSIASVMIKFDDSCINTLEDKALDVFIEYDNTLNLVNEFMVSENVSLKDAININECSSDEKDSNCNNLTTKNLKKNVWYMLDESNKAIKLSILDNCTISAYSYNLNGTIIGKVSKKVDNIDNYSVNLPSVVASDNILSGGFHYNKYDLFVSGSNNVDDKTKCNKITYMYKKEGQSNYKTINNFKNDVATFTPELGNNVYFIKGCNDADTCSDDVLYDSRFDNNPPTILAPAITYGNDAKITFEDDFSKIESYCVIKSSNSSEQCNWINFSGDNKKEEVTIPNLDASDYKIYVKDTSNNKGEGILTVNKANGSGRVTIDDWTYGDSVTKPISSSATNGAVTYTWYNSSKTKLSSQPSSTSDVGTYYVRATFASTTNYNEYTTDYVSFLVNKRSLTVKATDQSKNYDGSSLSADRTCSVISGSVVSGHTLSCESTGSQTNVGSSTKKLSKVTIKNGFSDVSLNYNVTKTNGTLTVNAVPINGYRCIGADRYFITTCDSETCNYTSKNDSNTMGIVVRKNLDTVCLSYKFSAINGLWVAYSAPGYIYSLYSDKYYNYTLSTSACANNQCINLVKSKVYGGVGVYMGTGYSEAIVRYNANDGEILSSDTATYNGKEFIKVYVMALRTFNGSCLSKTTTSACIGTGSTISYNSITYYPVWIAASCGSDGNTCSGANSLTITIK